MKYTTRDEFDHFEFSEIHVSDVTVMDGSFKAYLDDVVILPENSCNRDIRKMRCNDFVLSIIDAQIESFIQEGYKTYNADGVLMTEGEDVEISKLEYPEVFKNFQDAYAFSIEKTDDKYTFVIDGTDEKTYCITVKGSGDLQEWDRFLNLE